MKMDMMAWLEARGIEIETASRFGIREYQKDGKVWIKIPFVKDGMAVNHKHRCLDEKTFTQDGGAVKCFWNEDVLFDQSLASEPVIITEGEFDAMAAVQCGFVRTMSVPDGAPAKPIQGDSAKYSYLTQEAIEALRKAPYVILAVDGDQAGANLLQDLSIRIGRDVCKWVKYPKDCKDLNDALKAYGARGVQETLSRAQWVKVDGVFKMSEFPPRPERAVYDTGLDGLEHHLKIRLGDFMVVSGIPSHGKSTWVNDLCCTLARKHGLKTAFASFEQDPTEDHRRNLRQWALGYAEPWTSGALVGADKWIDESFCFIYPTDYQSENEDLTLSWVLEKAAVAVKRLGANIVVVDPWNELDHIRPTNMSMTDYVSYAIKQFRQFARVYNVLLVIVAHPTKLKKEGGKYPIPTLYDVSDSAHWANKADIGIIIYKDRKEDWDSFTTTVSIQKIRYQGTLGSTGNIDYFFNVNTKRFELKTHVAQSYGEVIV